MIAELEAGYDCLEMDIRIWGVKVGKKKEKLIVHTSLINNPLLAEELSSSSDKKLALYFPPSTIHCNFSPF